jgi:superfamily I DNA/RNA helicase
VVSILNEDQVRAATFPGKHLIVNAGPGSGVD